MSECEAITQCEKQQYDEPIVPVEDHSNDFIQEYDSLEDITDPKPYTIYVVDGTAYYYQDGDTGQKHLRSIPTTQVAI